MIKNKLSILLAQRNLKITRVAKDTGISRNTITSTAQNDTEMIRIETINTLCKYLNILPSDFFEFRPVDLDFTMAISSMPFTIDSNKKTINFTQLDADIFLDIETFQEVKSYQLKCNLDFNNTIFDINLNEGERNFSLNVDFKDEEEGTYFHSEIYSDLQPFYADIYKKLCITIKDEIYSYLKEPIKDLIAMHPNKASLERLFYNSGISAIDDVSVSVNSKSFHRF